MMQQPSPAVNGAPSGPGQIPSDQQAYHQQQQSWMMMQQQQQQQQHQGQQPTGWNPQSAPSSGQQQQQQQYGVGSQNQGSGGEIRSLWIGDLQPWMDEGYLMNIFALTGEAQSAKVLRNKQSGYSEGYGFIEFVSHAAAERILQTYNGAQMPSSDQTFRLNWAQLGAGERRQAEGPEHTVFVGDLAPDVTDYMLTETFRGVYSSVKGAKVVTNRTTGRSKGYGFVWFGDESEQIRAMTEMNGQYCSSRPMRIGPAANKKPLTMQQPAAYQNTQGNPGENDPTNTTIFVGALDQSVTEDLLKSVFCQFGELVHVKISAGKRCGFVQYANRVCAEQALSMLNGTQLGGQSIRLSWGRTPSNKQMASRFQEASLVTSPSYPNAIAWSSENLIAVAAGHLVIILNPALPAGPRGLITILNADPFQIGLVRSQDLLTGGLLPSSLKRERHPCVRSLSWSDIGMSENHGCLLAVCTAEGRVKLYRPPYSDFCAEWIEIVDVSDMLCENLSRMNFGESNNPSTSLSKDLVVRHDHEDDVTISVLMACKKRRKSRDNTLHQKSFTDQASCSKQESHQTVHNVLEIEAYEQPSYASKNCNREISPENYVSREALLSSLSIAWSSLLRFSLEGSSCKNMLRFSLLAVGSKSGSVSIWKVHAPECYDIGRSTASPCVELTAIIQAHSSWVSTMSWGIFGCDSSDPQVVLVTGSCDGSVKVWMSNKEDLQKYAEVYKSSFCLLKQVVAVNPVPVSTLSLIVINHDNGMHLAIGKGSGSFEVWKCEISTRKFEQIASTSAHGQVITGFGWSYDGRCLYSCSQDNYLRNWILCENTISEVPIPANTPGLNSTTDLPDVFLSCLGVALSPGNLAVALVRSFNVELLNQMYQARSQKAAVEFLWNGAQQSREPEDSDSSETITEAILGFSTNEFAYWESNLLWLLKEFEDLNKPLVLWDFVAAMLAFKQSMPEFVELVITKWLSVSYLGFHADIPIEELVPKIAKRLSDVPSRLLHILNVISRRVMLSELKTEEINRKLQGQRTNSEEETELWVRLLEENEKELRERLVGLSFSAYITAQSNRGTSTPSTGNWHPAGLAQMQQWVAINQEILHSELKTLSAEVKSSQTRSSDSTGTTLEEEICPYCTAPVHFHSPEEAFCEPPQQYKKKSKEKMRCDQRHKLERCCVSMKLCPPTPLWFCKCCHRMTLEFAPETLFALPSFPTDLKSLPESSFSSAALKPFCLFCGVLLQRKQPEFLLSASPV